MTTMALNDSALPTKQSLWILLPGCSFWTPYPRPPGPYHGLLCHKLIFKSSIDFKSQLWFWMTLHYWLNKACGFCCLDAASGLIPQPGPYRGLLRHGHGAPRPRPGESCVEYTIHLMPLFRIRFAAMLKHPYYDVDVWFAKKPQDRHFIIKILKVSYF
jgi:hypothetical protein